MLQPCWAGDFADGLQFLSTRTRGLAGELGHIPSEPEGQRCSCGNRGCLQTVAGSDAIVGALQHAGRTDVQDIAAAAGLVHGGDRTAREVFQRAGEALRCGLAMLLNLLNLEAIGLCGEPAILSSGVYLDTVRDTLGRRAFSTAADDCDLWIEERTDELEARGAASMVFDHLVDSESQRPTPRACLTAHAGSQSRRAARTSQLW